MPEEVLVLASTSPRRVELLESMGLPFRQVDPAIEEGELVGKTPVRTAALRARAKALAVARVEPDSRVLAADTVVALGDEVLGSARDEAQVRDMLRRLSGRTHAVHTAVALREPGSEDVTVKVDTTWVTFRHLPDEEVEWYVGSHEGVGKAGGYAIQGLGGMLVRFVDGDRETVVGLPTALVWEMLGGAPGRRADGD